jgi:capsular polysaccharide transport system permease protein
MMLLRRGLISDGRISMRAKRLLGRANPLFFATVIVPTAAAIAYFGFLASDVYLSQSQYVVRSPDKPAASGLGILLKSVGFSNAGDEIFITQDYVKSRDALRSLNRDRAVERAYGNPAISVFDRFNPFGWSGSFEDLYNYYGNKIAIEHDTTSSITTLTVKAFTPEDARRMNGQLLDLSEALVNRLNNRGEFDLLGFAQREAHEAEVDARRASQALAAFRNRQGIIDPERQAAVQLELVSKLQDELIGARLQLQQLQSLAPENPQIPLLRTRIAGLTRQVDSEVSQVAGGRGSLSANAVQYQRLALDREYADKRLAAALASLQEARNEGRRKQAYVERIVEPNLPDEAQQPRRFRGIVATLILGLVAYGILTMLLAGVREHRD